MSGYWSDRGRRAEQQYRPDPKGVGDSGEAGTRGLVLSGLSGDLHCSLDQAYQARGTDLTRPQILFVLTRRM